jgi:hypothetical protein
MPLWFDGIKPIDMYEEYNVLGKKRAGVVIRTSNGMQLVDAIGNHCKRQTVALMGMLRNVMLLLQHHCWGGQRKTRSGCRHRI